MAHLVIVGGSDAGTSAALRAREVDPGLEVTMLLADRYPNFSVCGLPYYIGGEVADFASMAHRSPTAIEGFGVRLLMEHTATAIDAAARALDVHAPDGSTLRLRYDRLIVATGAQAIRPSIPGTDLPGVFVMRSAADALAVDEYLRDTGATSAAIVGGGYIGCEMAEAFRRRGLRVTLLEAAPAPIPNLDPELGALAAAALTGEGVEVRAGTAVRAITQRRDDSGSRHHVPLQVHCDSGEAATADVVLLAVGVRPVTTLAESAGVRLGVRGAIGVTRRLETSVAGIYAAGDCAETWHRMLQRPAYLPLGSTAHKQGRVAGENAAGGDREFEGSLGTQVVKVYDLVVARTGLLEREVREAGLDAVTADWQGHDHKPYYPGAIAVRVRLTAERGTGRLLGAQIGGHRHAEIARRIDVCATAIATGLSVRQLEDMDLSYTPPLGTPWDVLQQAAIRLQGIGSRE
ncbi:MAG: FAD-dependent oxidoreductase [Anaerolineae bacterium]